MPNDPTTIQLGRIMVINGSPGDGLAVLVSTCHLQARWRKQSRVRNGEHDGIENGLIPLRSANDYGIQKRAGNLRRALNGRMPQRGRAWLKHIWGVT